MITARLYLFDTDHVTQIRHPNRTSCTVEAMTAELKFQFADFTRVNRAIVSFRSSFPLDPSCVSASARSEIPRRQTV
jgi:hypothetical protein